MQDLDETTLTSAVLDTFAQARTPRIRQVSEALVRHLHAFIREIEPSEAEWAEGIAFLTASGRFCSATRQEFILLSDALGVSMLVDALNHRQPEESTETTVLGPFFVAAAPQVEPGAHIGGRLPGAPLLIDARVLDADGAPLPGATVDLWHADRDGLYDVQRADAGLAGRARLTTDDAGSFHVWSVLPSHYPIPHDGPVGRMLEAQGRHPFRPAHVHFMIEAPGHARLVTHVFLSDSEYLDSDVVFGVKRSLIRMLEHRPAHTMSRGHAPAQPYHVLRTVFRLAAARG
ncbi:MAG TPA: dioxygenase [Steroidobacteraceae bacterium]|nr:dioxygenase [Steroidobacteraceae bacterium]